MFPRYLCILIFFQLVIGLPNFSPPWPQKISFPLYGNMFSTAYWFADIYFGTPIASRQSLIVDTGSNVLSFPCNDCQSRCGSHIDVALNLKLSKTVTPIPCKYGCSICAHNWDSADTHFGEKHQSSVDICAYYIEYLEGSSLIGRWYQDEAWIRGTFEPASIDGYFVEKEIKRLRNRLRFMKQSRRQLIDIQKKTYRKHIGSIDRGNHLSVVSNSDLIYSQDQFNTDYISLKKTVEVPFGCNFEETNLFQNQIASGILGLEAESTFGPKTFIFSMMSAIFNIKTPKFGATLSSLKLDKVSEYSPYQPLFALCIAENGGILSIGTNNSEYHVKKHQDVRKIHLFDGILLHDIQMRLSEYRQNLTPYNVHLKKKRYLNKSRESRFAPFYIPTFLEKDDEDMQSNQFERLAEIKKTNNTNINTAYVNKLIEWIPILSNLDKDGRQINYMIKLLRMSIILPLSPTINNVIDLPIIQSLRFASYKDDLAQYSRPILQQEGLHSLVDSGTTITQLPFLLYINFWAAFTRSVLIAHSARILIYDDSNYIGIKRVSGTNINTLYAVCTKISTQLQKLIKLLDSAYHYLEKNQSQDYVKKQENIIVIKKHLMKEHMLAEMGRNELMKLNNANLMDLLKESSFYNILFDNNEDRNLTFSHRLLVNRFQKTLSTTRILNDLPLSSESNILKNKREHRVKSKPSSFSRKCDYQHPIEATRRLFEKYNLRNQNILVSLDIPEMLLNSNSDTLQEECWNLPNNTIDFMMFPNIQLHFENDVKYLWQPDTYLYRHTNTSIYCLTIVSTNSGEEILNFINKELTPIEISTTNRLNEIKRTFENRIDRCITYIVNLYENLVILGVSFFLKHDIIFNLGNWSLGVANANCPQHDLSNRR